MNSIITSNWGLDKSRIQRKIKTEKRPSSKKCKKINKTKIH